MIFTTSWDDGYQKDLQIAQLLNRYDCKGTFYVCPAKQHNEMMLSEEQIFLLSKRHEIGAHTINHPRLTTQSHEQAWEEIQQSKQWIEDITKKKCIMFCYPKGDYNNATIQIVKEVGFQGARTVQRLETSIKDPFQMPTTLHVYTFPWRKRWTRLWHCLDPLGPYRVMQPQLQKFGISLWQCRSWLPMAKALFDYAYTSNAPVFHLWGHSEEVDRLKMWVPLQSFLEYVSTFKDVKHMTNGEIISEKVK